MSERDTLVAACVVRGLPFDGKTPVLRKRLLDYMMSDATPVTTPIATPVPEPPTSPASPGPTSPAPVPKPGANKKPKRPPSAYNLFVRDTLPAVINDGFKGKEAMVEVAKRWKAQKTTPPLLLTDESGSSTSEDTAVDKLIDGLFTLDMASLRANLAAMKHPINGTKAQLVERLAVALLG